MANNSTIYNNAYVVTNAEQLVIVIMVSLLIVMSVFGNVSMLTIIYRNKKLWISTYMLIGNLSAVGLAVAVFAMPFSIASIVSNKWPFPKEVCTANGFVNSMLLLSTIFTHTLISVGRYFAVVRPHSGAMTKSNTKVIIGSIWLVALLLSVGPLLRFGRYDFGRSSFHCGIGFPQTKLEKAYLYALIGVAFLVPIIVMGYVYSRILKKVRRHSKRLRASRKTSTAGESMDIQRRLVIATVSSLGCFFFCWTPFCIFVILGIVVKSPDKLPRGMGIAAYLCGFSYNAINPIVISSICSGFKEGFRDLMRISACAKRQPFKFMGEKCTLCRLLDKFPPPEEPTRKTTTTFSYDGNGPTETTNKKSDAPNEKSLLSKTLSNNDEYLIVTYL